MAFRVDVGELLGHPFEPIQLVLQPDLDVGLDSRLMNDRESLGRGDACVLEFLAHPVAAHRLPRYRLFEEKSVFLDPAERPGQAEQTWRLGRGRTPQSLDDPLRAQASVPGLHLAVNDQRSGRRLQRVAEDGADLWGISHALDLDLRIPVDIFRCVVAEPQQDIGDRLCVCGAREAGHGRIERVEPEGVLGFVEEAGEADPTDGVARARGLLDELCAELVPCLPAERAPGNEPERTLLLTFSYGDLVHGPVAIVRG